MEQLNGLQKKADKEILKKGRTKKQDLTAINYFIFMYVAHQF